MTSPPEKIGIECPGCQEVYEDWVQRSLEDLLDEAWSGVDLEAEAKSTCPYCGNEARHEYLVQGTDGVWRIDPVEDPD